MELEVAKPVRSEPHRELLLDLQIVMIVIVQRMRRSLGKDRMQCEKNQDDDLKWVIMRQSLTRKL